MSEQIKKCELCNEPLTEDNETIWSDVRCVDCYEEWNDYWPDRI